MREYDVVVVGAGMAAAALVIALRQKRYTGSVALLGSELTPPYDRPALSKDYLTGERPVERLLIRPEVFWSQSGVELLVGRTATLVDAANHVIHCHTGEAVRYRNLVWAAGSSPRPLELPGLPPGMIAEVRSLNDVDRLRERIAAASRIAIAGAGFIGLEIAPGLLKQGKAVTLIESAPRLLERRAAPVVSRFLADLHAGLGSTLHLGAAIDQVRVEDGRLRGLQLQDHAQVPCDLLISAIGTVPVVEPLQVAGAEVANGVKVDAYCRTNLPDVYAIGDCAVQGNPFAGGAQVRIESVQNATDQARCVASALAGSPEPFRAVPWFWSNQHTVRLQTAGLSMGYEAAVTRGDPASGRFSVCYLRQGHLIAVDCINQPRDFAQAKTLIGKGTRATPRDLADLGRSLADLATPRTD